jgi:2'-5' RNA ligase
VKPEQIHITLKFLGEVGEERLGDLKAALHRSAEHFSGFFFSLHGIGCFPDSSRARVLWAGADAGKPELEALSRSVEEETVSAGFPPSDKPFSAHLTLARIQSEAPEQFQSLALQFRDFRFGEIPVRKMDLVQSRLSVQGAEHITRETFPFHDH